MIKNILKELTEAVWGQTTLEMGFIKFFITFVVIFILYKMLTEGLK